MHYSHPLLKVFAATFTSCGRKGSHSCKQIIMKWLFAGLTDFLWNNSALSLVGALCKLGMTELDEGASSRPVLSNLIDKLLLPLLIFVTNLFLPSLRFLRWYYDKKLCHRRHTCNAVELKPIVKENSPTPHGMSALQDGCPFLAKFLTNEDALFLLAPHLHYADIVSLSLASESICQIIFATNVPPIPPHAPSGPTGMTVGEQDSGFPSAQRRTLETQSCLRGKKSSCWLCGIQICGGCDKSRMTEDPKTSTHLERCSPYCARCYYTLICKRVTVTILGIRKGWWKYSGKTCDCKRRVDKKRKFCRWCGAAGVKWTKALQEEREQRMITARRATSQNCLGCDRSISTEQGKGALRWWRCCVCMKACVDECHTL